VTNTWAADQVLGEEGDEHLQDETLRHWLRHAALRQL